MTGPVFSPFVTPMVTLRTFRERTRSIFQSERWTSPDPATGDRRFVLSLERGALLLAGGVFAAGLASATAATLGLFRLVAPVILLVLAGLIGLLVVAAVRGRVMLRGDGHDLLALCLALIAAASAGLLHHHYFAGQADIGFYVSDANIIAQTGGRFLDGLHDVTLPGFEATPSGARVTAMFGYTSLGALFVYAAGPFAVPWVNAPLAFITSLMLYIVGRRMGGGLGGVAGLLLWHASFLTLWLSRWVMTENAALATLWTGIVLFLSVWKTWDPLRVALLLVTLGFAAIVRPEGSLVAAWLVLLLVLRHRRGLIAASRRAARVVRANRGRLVAVGAAAAIGAVMVALLVSALPFAYLRAGLDLAMDVGRGRPAADAVDVPTDGPSPNWGDVALRYEWESAVAYGIPFFAIPLVLGLATRLVRPRVVGLVALALVPYALFIFMPPVTTAHPWFMRRLWVGLVPFLFVGAGASVDPWRAGFRWPVRSRARDEPRVALMGVSILVLSALLFVQFDASGAYLARREQDSVQPVMTLLEPYIGPQSAILVDEGAVQYAPMLRFGASDAVVGWFNQRPLSFEHSFAAADAAETTYLLRASLGQNTFASDPGGATMIANFTAEFSNPPRRDFRVYIANPPMAQGYAPLASYLEDDVPPTGWEAAERRFELLEARSPLVLVKHVHFEPGQWVRTTDGMQAIASPSALVFNLTQIRPDILQNSALSVYIAYPQLWTDDRPLYGYDGTFRPLNDTLRSDGTGTLRIVAIALPRPMTYQAVAVPAGTVVRGALLDLS